MEYGHDENCEAIKFERIHRTYYLDKPLASLKFGFFELIEDGVYRRKCYMSDDRMRLMEC